MIKKKENEKPNDYNKLYYIIYTCIFAVCRNGNLDDIAKAGSFHDFLMELHEQFGPIVSFWWEKQYAVSIASAELFEEQQHLFDRPRKFRKFAPSIYIHIPTRLPALLQIFCRNKLRLYTIQVFRRKLSLRRILSEFKMGHLCGLQM